MNAEIIAIGTELLLGVTVDTNSAFLASQLAKVGIRVERITLVGDDLPELVDAIRQASARSGLVVCSGGLGPTGDDLTREAIAQALERPLEFHQELLDEIEARFVAFKRTMSPSNRQQAFVPEGGYILRNPRGTAPAFVAHRDGQLVAALPGVPSELQWLTDNALIPYLREFHNVNTVRVVREIHASGLSEADAGERIAELFNLENPVVGITAKGGQYIIRIAATANSVPDAEALIAPMVETIRERLGSHVLETEKLEERIARLLSFHNVSLALRETTLYAPVLRLLQANEGSRAALAQGGVTIKPATEKLSKESVEVTAHDLQWASSAALALVVMIEPTVDTTGLPIAPPDTMVTAHYALSDGESVEYASRGFDLTLAAGYDLIAVSALELLRRHLELST